MRLQAAVKLQTTVWGTARAPALLPAGCGAPTPAHGLSPGREEGREAGSSQLPAWKRLCSQTGIESSWGTSTTPPPCPWSGETTVARPRVTGGRVTGLQGQDLNWK